MFDVQVCVSVGVCGIATPKRIDRFRCGFFVSKPTRSWISAIEIFSPVHMVLLFAVNMSRGSVNCLLFRFSFVKYIYKCIISLDCMHRQGDSGDRAATPTRLESLPTVTIRNHCALSYRPLIRRQRGDQLANADSLPRTEDCTPVLPKEFTFITRRYLWS